MKKTRLYLWATAALCALLAALLAAGIVGIYRDGAAAQAAGDGAAWIFTRQKVAERFAPLVPLGLALLALTVASLCLGIRDDGADKPVQDARIALERLCARVSAPSEAMERERRIRKRLRWGGWLVFVLCMAPAALYLADPAHFGAVDPEREFGALARGCFPWIAAGFGALALGAALRERSLRRELEAARALLKAERAEAPAPAPTRPAVPAASRAVPAIRAALLLAGAVCIALGARNGSLRDVLYKAVTICTECVGLG